MVDERVFGAWMNPLQCLEVDEPWAPHHAHIVHHPRIKPAPVGRWILSGPIDGETFIHTSLG